MQKTAYEMRISDWSSDVCSSDLHCRRRRGPDAADPAVPRPRRLPDAVTAAHPGLDGRPAPRRRGAAPAVAGGQQRRPVRAGRAPRPGRSEEHTSELQSLMRISYAVFCLKKKKNETQTKRTASKNKNNKQNKENIYTVVNNNMRQSTYRQM